MKGLSQSKLAELVEISPTFMMHIEHGSRGASLETVELLARALEVDIAALFLKPREVPPISVETESLRIAFEHTMLEKIYEAVRVSIDEYYSPSP
jgi:transcriptional regulator with XRE-family HTH domain